ncbi:hypothetical protein AAHA92_07592 [Salvia divinorum]|uniref:TF-B3 domain-containing protein n=1 Tax=Salvia divinorum TaxID=28513 RepID=A0ABD1I9H3_SALDI
MEATISQRSLTRSLDRDPKKSIVTLFDAPNFPPQNPNHEVAIPDLIPPRVFMFKKDLTPTDIMQNRQDIPTEADGVRYNSGAMFLQSQWRHLVNRNELFDGDSVVGYGYRNNRGQFRLVISVNRKDD